MPAPLNLIVIRRIMQSRDPSGLIFQVCRDLDVASLRALFIEVTRSWPHPMRHDECYTVGSFEDLEMQLDAERAFMLVPNAALLVLEQTEPSLRETALSLLAGIARRSGTTETPPALVGLIPALRLVGGGSSWWEAFRTWYRLDV